MIFAIATFLANRFGLGFQKARFYAVAGICGLILLVIAVSGYWISSCNQRSFEKKKDEIKTNVTTGKVESNVQQNVINQAANVSNQALTNVDAVKNTNINTFSNSYDEARRRYCEAFPEDCR